MLPQRRVCGSSTCLQQQVSYPLVVNSLSDPPAQPFKYPTSLPTLSECAHVARENRPPFSFSNPANNCQPRQSLSELLRTWQGSYPRVTRLEESMLLTQFPAPPRMSHRCFRPSRGWFTVGTEKGVTGAPAKQIYTMSAPVCTIAEWLSMQLCTLYISMRNKESAPFRTAYGGGVPCGNLVEYDDARKSDYDEAHGCITTGCVRENTCKSLNLQ